MQLPWGLLWRSEVTLSSKRSKVYPPYKTQYRVGNWAEYERGLVRRGDATLWISESATRAWRAEPTGRRGAQPKFSDLAIETALTVRLVFNLPLRQTEGFLQSLLGLMGLDLSAPDHTTLSRRGRALSTRLARLPSSRPIHLAVDSSGLAVHGEGEWAAARRGGNPRRGWRKLHLGVDESGVIVAQVMSEGSANDAEVAPSVIKQSGAVLESFVADTAYDAGAVYRASMSRGARVVVPPVRAAVVRRSKAKWRLARNESVARVREVGRRQ